LEKAVASLRELQSSFASAIRTDDSAANAAVPVRPAANLGIYRHNAAWQFRNALSLSFPVVCRRVGDDYFRQLAWHYRRAFPSRSGDLHWVGRHFAEFLASHLAGSDYAWLADLARLEWSRELASVAEILPAATADSLATFAADDLENLSFALQPSLQLNESEYPVASVWLANQIENAPPVDQSVGKEAYMALAGNDGVKLTRLDYQRFSFLRALASGACLGEAVTTAGLDEAGLLGALQFLFAEGLVCGIHSEKR
jgi:hypothetical protein